MKKIWIINTVVFLAAFLLFQIELVISKILLPKFGGSYLVWGAALVFFQVTLLLGYIYSHFVIRKYGINRYKYFHVILVLASLLFFPGRPLPLLVPQENIPLVINVFLQLLYSIGPAFFVLSTTSIIFQAWLADSELPQKTNPYRLYAVSNLGSFLGLFTYPFIFEAFLDLDQQLAIWSIFYVILVVFHYATLKFVKVKPLEKHAEELPENIKLKEKIIWFLLGMVGVFMFLSVTNIATYEIAPMPLLWIIPLGIYLISFTLNFKDKPWCPAWITEKFYIMVPYGVILFFFTQIKLFPFIILLICHLVLLFIFCMFCQNELAKRKPKGTRNLTLFYVIISSGGAIASFLVAWIIPLVSIVMIEYLMGLFILALVLLLDVKAIKIDAYGIRLLHYLIFLIILWPRVFKSYNVFGIVFLIWALRMIFNALKTKPYLFCCGLFAITVLSPFLDDIWSSRHSIYKHRNYYGIYRVYIEEEKRFLLNGTTLHGAQYIINTKEMVPLMYYHYATPVGKVLTSPVFHFKHIGLIGLGTGTLAVYGKTDQTMDFFELDPDVFDIATKYFTYYNKSISKKRCIFGDARLSLRKVPEGYYDLLVVDAFSGDSVPVHLLTVEAIFEFMGRLTEKGIILFHISNRYLDLEPVLFSNAKALGLYVCADSNNNSHNGEAYASRWVALTRDAQTFEKLTSQLKWNRDVSYKTTKDIRPWTDKYSNLLSIFVFQNLSSQIKDFQPFYWSFDLNRRSRIDAEYYSTQGNFYYSQGNIEQAMAYYKKAMALDPRVYNARVMYDLLGKSKQAVINLQKALDKNPKDAASYIELGHIYQNLKQDEKAIASYKKAIELNPKNIEAYRGIGNAYKNMKQYQQAIENYKKIVQLDPQALDAYNEIGFNYYSLGQLQEAVVYFEKAITINPGHAAAYYNLGMLYNNSGQRQKARENLQKAKDLLTSSNDTQLRNKIEDLLSRL